MTLAAKLIELLLLQKRAPDADVGKVIVAVALHDLAPSVGGSGVFARVVLLGRLVDHTTSKATCSGRSAA